MRSVVWVCLFLVMAVGAALAGPLDKPAFTATPAELLAEAAAIPASGHDIEVMRDDVTYTFDARGRVEARYRTVFAVRAQSGADGWGTIGLGWQPFYQDQPTIRARVVNTDGSVTDFDPKLAHDAPAVKESPSVFSDRRDLSAPLPRLSVGAVVEQEFVFVDREPLLAAGTVRWLYVQRSVPIARKVMTVSAPTALRAKVVLRGPSHGWKPTTRTVGDRTIVTYDLSKIAPSSDGTAGVPVDTLQWPVIGIATGASWAAIAADYRALVEAKLATPVTVPPDLIAATPRATVDRVLAWLHGRVRYTGIELSASAIVPFAPAETLARGFGDCKDKATLLVALLRAAKIPADLALLSTGPGTDVDVALPGMGEFDHAIVRARVDGKDLWIDATEDLFPAGQLPVRDQGRRALVITAGTKALTTTPVSAPLDNLVREVRTFRLSEHGAGSVTEVAEEHGIWSDNLRGFVRNNTTADVAKHLGTYASEEYQGTYRSHSSTPAGDVTTPFVFTTEVADAKRSGADRDELWAWVYPTDVLAKLPDTISSTDPAIERNLKARTLDYVWSVPHVYEIVNRLEVPAGYTTPELPASETRALGTMTLTTTRSATAGGYAVTYRLDTGKRQITADQLRATREAVRKLRAENAILLPFDLEGRRLASLGKAREGIAAIQKLVALHPKEALHHLQLANEYYLLGLGEAARREAKLATTLEPKNGDAWATIGFLLRRDLTSRLAHPGSDRAGALTALRKALALSPTHVGARDELAQLLSADADGRLTTDRAAHREVVPILRALRDEQVGDYDERLVIALAMSDDRSGLEELGRTLPDGDARRHAVVLAAAMKSGDAAVRAANSLAGRDALLDYARGMLMMMERYDAARAVTRANPASAAIHRKIATALRPIAADRLPPEDPMTPAILIVKRMLLGPLAKPPWSPGVEAALAPLTEAMKAYRDGDASVIPATTMLDSLVAAMTFSTQGDAKAGWTVTISSGNDTFTLYVVLRNKRAYVVGGSSFTAGVGDEALQLLGRGDLAGARAWITRVLDDPALTLTPPAVAMLQRHRAEVATATKAQLELLSTILTQPSAPASVVPRLRACAGYTADEDRAVCLRGAMEITARAHDWTTASSIAREALALAGDDVDMIAMLAQSAAFAPTGSADAEAALTAALAKHPNEPQLLRAQAFVGFAGGWSIAGPRFARLVAASSAEPNDLNNAAWAHLFFDAKPDAARDLIERAMQATSTPPIHFRNTYAAVLAEVGEPAAAWAELMQVLPAFSPPSDADQYVRARIAEQVGLRDDAIAIYRSLPRGVDAPGHPSTWDFAQQRLKAMGVTP